MRAGVKSQYSSNKILISFLIMSTIYSTEFFVFAGKLYDTFGTYDVAFFVAGGLILFTSLGFVLLELDWFKSKSSSNKK